MQNEELRLERYAFLLFVCITVFVILSERSETKDLKILFYSRGGPLCPPVNREFSGGHGSPPLQFLFIRNSNRRERICPFRVFLCYIVGADAHISPHDVCYTVRCGHRTLHAFLLFVCII